MPIDPPSEEESDDSEDEDESSEECEDESIVKEEKVEKTVNKISEGKLKKVDNVPDDTVPVN